jgi:hypothetical protein
MIAAVPAVGMVFIATTLAATVALGHSHEPGIHGHATPTEASADPGQATPTEAWADHAHDTPTEASADHDH